MEAALRSCGNRSAQLLIDIVWAGQSPQCGTVAASLSNTAPTFTHFGCLQEYLTSSQELPRLRTRDSPCDKQQSTKQQSHHLSGALNFFPVPVINWKTIQNGICSLHTSSCSTCFFPLCCGRPHIASDVSRSFFTPPAIRNPANQNGANKSARKGQSSPGSVRWSVNSTGFNCLSYANGSITGGQHAKDVPELLGKKSTWRHAEQRLF